MGSYSPVPGVGTAGRRDRGADAPAVIDELVRARGTPFRGVLYAG
jgi:phosphoribosylamine-glycine ligase